MSKESENESTNTYSLEFLAHKNEIESGMMISLQTEFYNLATFINSATEAFIKTTLYYTLSQDEEITKSLILYNNKIRLIISKVEELTETELYNKNTALDILHEIDEIDILNTHDILKQIEIQNKLKKVSNQINVDLYEFSNYLKCLNEFVIKVLNSTELQLNSSYKSFFEKLNISCGIFSTLLLFYKNVFVTLDEIKDITSLLNLDKDINRTLLEFSRESKSRLGM